MMRCSWTSTLERSSRLSTESSTEAPLIEASCGAKWPFAPHCFLDCHLRGDVRVRLVVLQFEIGALEFEDILHLADDLHRGQWIGSSHELLARLLQVIQVKVRIAQGMHEIAGLQAGHLRDH